MTTPYRFTKQTPGSFMSFLLFMFLSANSFSQDNHYAWMQFGSRNSLLNNANMSRFEDQSAAIINPATLSSATQSSFNFNTNAVGFNRINFKNGLGEGFTLRNSALSILPSMASGVIKPKSSQKQLAIGYAIYTSNTDHLNFSDRVNARYDLVPEAESAGDENYLAQYNIITVMDEVSVVGGVGWNLSPSASIGLSQHFIYRAQEYTEKFSAYAVPDTNTGASIDLTGTNLDYYARYYKIISFTKIGLHLRSGHWDFGLTLATPTFGIMGTGYILADYDLANVRLGDDPEAERANYLINGEFTEIKAKYKYPWNVSLGASRAWGKTRFYGSITYYGSINPYSILKPANEAFIQPPITENELYSSEYLDLWSVNRSVINASIAVDWTIRPDYHMLFSFRNDAYYSSFDKENAGKNPAIKQWDNYHLTCGTQRTFGRSEWVVGARLNLARRNDYPQPVSFSDPTEDSFFKGDRKTGVLTATGLQLMISYTFSLTDPAEK